MASALEQLVLALLAKQPAQRPQTAGEVSQLLAGIATEHWGEEAAAAWWNARTREPAKPG